MPVTRKAVAEFYFHMGRHTQATPAQCERLLRYAATLTRLAVEQCNREDWGERDYAKRERIKRQVLALCRQIDSSIVNDVVVLSVRPVFSNDPRGACLKIAVPDGFYMDWGKEGICVPA